MSCAAATSSKYSLAQERSEQPAVIRVGSGCLSGSFFSEGFEHLIGKNLFSIAHTSENVTFLPKV
jgi:hypothetical protein